MSDMKHRLTESGENEQEAPANVGASSIEEQNPQHALQENSTVTLTGKRLEVTVIREGVSANNRYYSRQVLEESIPLWEGEEVCAYGWDPAKRDHVPAHVEKALPQGTYLNKIGFLQNVRGRVVENRFELVADFVCTKEALRQEILETHEAN